jgi:4-alpha-glucanotransferase
MKWLRSSGILLHPTSLPGPYGIGDLGPMADRFLDFLAAGRQKLWQVLPLGPTGYGNSPYQTLSAFAGNPLLIAPERLVEDGLLTPAELDDHPRFPEGRVDYGAVIPWKAALLRQAFRRFSARPHHPVRADFDTFRAEHSDWLEDYALFAALKEAHAGRAWAEWEPALARREPAALAAAREGLAEEIALHAFAQMLFARQWERVHAGAAARGIKLLGDLALFVAYDSADVWAHPELFQLDANGRPTFVAGVPPDYFSPTGQRWGNPLYHWEALRRTDYAWWIARARRAFALYDYVRLDHFRGFHAYWEIPAASATAVEGRWAPGPADALFAALRHALGDVPFIAEDLGLITPGVHALRQRLGFPGMRVLQFAFGSNAHNPHLPHTYTPDTVVYTGTHDNDTTRGWFAGLAGRERTYVLRYLRASEEDVVEEQMRAVLASVAALAVIPLQDALELGSEARMNVPSRPDGNWEWRCAAPQLTPAVSKRLAQLVALYGR